MHPPGIVLTGPVLSCPEFSHTENGGPYHNSKPLATADEIRSELVNGLCQCVLWKDSVRHLVDSGVTQFVEFGSGGVLAGLIRRIDRGVKVSTVSDTASMRKLAEIEA